MRTNPPVRRARRRIVAAVAAATSVGSLLTLSAAQASTSSTVSAVVDGHCPKCAVSVTGASFQPGDTITLTVRTPAGTATLGTATANYVGAVNVSFDPSPINVAPGSYPVTAHAASANTDTPGTLSAPAPSLDPTLPVKPGAREDVYTAGFGDGEALSVSFDGAAVSATMAAPYLSFVVPASASGGNHTVTVVQNSDPSVRATTTMPVDGPPPTSPPSSSAPTTTAPSSTAPSSTAPSSTAPTTTAPSSTVPSTSAPSTSGMPIPLPSTSAASPTSSPTPPSTGGRGKKKGSRFVPLPPTRILDTRTGLGAPAGRTTAVPVQVTGQAGVPTTGVTAVVVNVTVTEPTAAGWAEVSPDGRFGSSNANYGPEQTVAALAVSAVDSRGRVWVTSLVPIHAVLDVQGYFTTTGAGSTLYSVAHARLLDTRLGAPLGPGETRRVPVLGVAGVPASGVSAVVLNTTATDPTSPTYLQAYPGGSPRPNASTVNVTAGQTRANRTIVPVGADGTIAYTNFAGTTDLVVDITGYFATDSGGAYFYPQAPSRVMDSRARWGHYTGFDNFIRASVTAGQADGYTPVAAWLTATTDTSSDVGWVAVAPATGGLPADTGTSDLNEQAAPTPNAVITGLGAGNGVDVTTGCSGQPCRNTAVILDLSALFGVPTG